MSKKMNRHTWLVKVLLALLTSCSSLLTLPAQEVQHKAYTAQQPLVYEDAWDLWPYVFLDDNGQPSGYNIDLLRLIMEQLGIPYTVKLLPTEQALEDLRSGKADLMMGMVSNYHDAYTLFYGHHSVQLFTHSVAHVKDSPLRLHTIEDMNRQQAIVHAGSFSHHLIEDRGWGDNAIPYADMDKAVQRVSAEGRGQILWNTASLKWLIDKYHADNLTLSPVDMPSGDYRFMSNDEHLLERIDQAYAQLLAADMLTPLEQKWFYPEKQHDSSIPRWGWYAVAAAAIVLLLLACASLLYRLRERKATHEGRLRNQRLSLILKTCKVKIWTYDLRRKVITWYGDTPHHVRTLSVEEFAQRYHPEDFLRLTEAVDRLAARKSEYERMEMDIMDGPDGEERAYTVTLSVMRAEHGTPTVIMGTKSDITEQRQQQQQSSELMLRYQAIFDTAMVDMVYYDSEGYITDMNERAQNTFHMSLDDTLKEHINLRDLINIDEFDFNSFNDTDYFYATLFLNTATENRNFESRKRKDVMSYELQVVPVYDSQHRMLGAYGTGREVTEVAHTYRQAQLGVEQLRQATQKATDHVNNINYAMQVGGVRIVSYSPDTHMITINHRMHEAQYVLTQQRCLDLADLQSVGQVMRVMRAMDRRALMPINCEVRTNLRLPGGKQLCLEMHLYPVLRADGTVDQYAGICRDTSEIKFTEKLLQQETEKAQEVEQVKNKFLHNMCFEIRPPLNTVVRYAEMFEQQHTMEEEELFISEIKDKSGYLLNLINDILFLSRLDAGMVEINPQPCDFAQTFDSHCQMGWNNLRKDGVSYVVESHYQQLVVVIDDANLGRIIEQVASNAATYTASGIVRARYDYIGGKLIISITDTGAGIAPDKLEHIFERFNTSSNKSKSTGLGLPICQELAKQLGGTIEISSEVGRGTSVWITMPCEAVTIEHTKEI